MKVACAQYAPNSNDIDENIAAFNHILGDGTDGRLKGVDILVLPERAFTSM